MKKIIALFVACLLTSLCAADEYGPFGTDYVIEQTRPTSLEDIDLTIHGEPMALGDCVALYRVSDSAYCGVGKVVEYKGALQLTITAYLVGGTKVHFKVWQKETDTVYDCDESCDYTIPTSGDGFVSGLVLTVTPVKEFGVGRSSHFTVKDIGKGTLVGASGITWGDFANTDYYGTKTFANESIVDAEKTAADDNDDYWCYPISDMNALFFTGWADNTSYATVDDMVGYFRAHPTYLWRGETEGKYESVFEWYKETTGIDLEGMDGVVTDGMVGSTFLSDLRTLLDDGSHVVRVNVDFDNVLYNRKWKGMSVLHGVLCVGYVADGDTLKALFLIDPDNDQYTGTGGTTASNSIMYCPVEWNATEGRYSISGVWGQDGWIALYWTALKVKDKEPEVFTVTFNKNGGTGTMPDQKFTEDVEQALTKNTFKKSGYMFVGWKDQNGGTYEDEQVITPTSDLTLTAQWKEIAVSCDPDKATFNWRGTDDKLLVGAFDVTCNTDWIVTPDKDWLVPIIVNGSNDGRVEYGLTVNDSAKPRSGTITVTSKIDNSVKAMFTVNQNARPTTPTPIVEDGVLLGVDMNDYDKFDIPADVTTIGAAALADNAEVKSIRIPASVTAIGGGAFAGCVNLTNVVFDGDAPATGSGIFTGTPGDLVVTVRNDKTNWPPDGGTWPEGDDDARTVAVIKNYIVSFDWNGWEDGPAIEAIVVEPGAKCPLPGRDIYSSDLDLWTKHKEGVRPGYAFDGWNETGLMADGHYDWDSYTPEGSVALKAIWWANTYRYKFDANGGKPASQEVSGQSFGEEWKKDEVEEPALANAVFDGWWTAKTGGERIDMDGVCSVVGKLGGTMTLYAHWRKMFKATVKDGTVVDGEATPKKDVTVLSGTELYLEAADKSDNNMEFAKWTYSPATANLGANFDPRDPNTTFAMPDAAVTFTANYIAKPGYVNVIAYEANSTLNEDDDPQGIEWSDDGKVWTPVGDGNAYPVKTGKSVAIQFRSTDTRWTVPAKVSYPIIEGETAEIEVAATRVSVIEADVLCEQFSASGTVTLAPKNGQVLPGKPVTLTAKAGKDTVFAYWLVDDEKVGYSATFKYAPDADCTVTAVFRLKSAVEDPVLDSDAVAPSANAMVGVAFKAQVPLADAAYPAKFSAKGLPAGLKIDAASGVISGVPTKAGDFTVDVTAAGGVNTKAKPTIKLPITIKPLPTWAQGAFTGYVTSVSDGEEPCTNYGLASFSVSTAGKVSGKVSLDGTNYTFGVESFDAESVTDSEDPDFVIKAELKAGKTAIPMRLVVRVAQSGKSYAGAMLYNAFAGGSAGGVDFKAWRTLWKDKDNDYAARGEIAAWEGIYTLSLADAEYGSGYWSLTVGKDGNVKASGKLADGTGVSAASPLMYDAESGYFALLYTAPSAYKGGAFALTVIFGDQPQGNLVMGAVSSWTSRNPQATGTYGKGFARRVGFTGAYYDKLVKLNEYYNSLRFGIDEAPSLSYTHKETYLNDGNKKVTESEMREAEAIDLSGQDGLSVTVDEKGALVVAKATKPVQDKVSKEWLYEGANDGGLTLSFTQATGIFKGSYTFWYDYESAHDSTTGKSTSSHTSKKVSFEGIVVQVQGEALRGFYLWDATGVYEDEKTGKEKTYKYNESYPVFFRK